MINRSVWRSRYTNASLVWSSDFPVCMMPNSTLPQSNDERQPWRSGRRRSPGSEMATFCPWPHLLLPSLGSRSSRPAPQLRGADAWQRSGLLALATTRSFLKSLLPPCNLQGTDNSAMLPGLEHLGAFMRTYGSWAVSATGRRGKVVVVVTCRPSFSLAASQVPHSLPRFRAPEIRSTLAKFPDGNRLTVS